jgi:MFS superfamily sulfate permease-like transporter
MVGLIPNTMLNGSSGGLGYASGFSYSIFLGLAVLVFSPLIGVIPMAALAGW